MSKEKSKLDKLNVPEMLYQHFIKDVPRGDSALVDRLHDTTPTNHGRGQTRILRELTQAEWDEVYSYAAHARSNMVGSDRETTLRGAICGKSLAERMEGLGVSNPVTYTPKRKNKPKAEKVETNEDEGTSTESEATTETEEDTNLDSTVRVPTEPMTIPTADDLEETGEDEQQGFMDDMNYGS